MSDDKSKAKPIPLKWRFSVDIGDDKFQMVRTGDQVELVHTEEMAASIAKVDPERVKQMRHAMADRLFAGDPIAAALAKKAIDKNPDLLRQPVASPLIKATLSCGHETEVEIPTEPPTESDKRFAEWLSSSFEPAPPLDPRHAHTMIGSRSQRVDLIDPYFKTQEAPPESATNPGIRTGTERFIKAKLVESKPRTQVGFPQPRQAYDPRHAHRRIGQPSQPIEITNVEMVPDEGLRFTARPVTSLGAEPDAKVQVWKCYGCQSAGFISWDEFTGPGDPFEMSAYQEIRTHDLLCPHQATFIDGFENGDPQVDLENLTQWLEYNEMDNPLNPELSSKPKS